MTVRKRAIRKTMTTDGQITAMPLCADIGILHTALLQEVAWLRDIAEMLREDVASAVSVLSVAECLCPWSLHSCWPPFSLFSCDENANMLKGVRLRLPLLFNQ